MTFSQINLLSSDSGILGLFLKLELWLKFRLDSDDNLFTVRVIFFFSQLFNKMVYVQIVSSSQTPSFEVILHDANLVAVISPYSLITYISLKKQATNTKHVSWLIDHIWGNGIG